MGRSLVHLSDNKKSVRFDTFYRGKFVETYHAFISIIEESRLLTIKNHTLPYFVPIDKLSSELLNKNLPEFTGEISNFLQRFVARREQLNDFRNYEKEIFDIFATESFNQISFKIPYKKE